MSDLLGALAVFLAVHAIPAIRPLRAQLVTLFGELVYIAAFSAISLGLVVWLGIAYAHAPYVELWSYWPEFKWLALLVMPVACVLSAAGLTSRNPFSLGAGYERFDPERPGIVRLTRHPAVWGLATWSAVHIPINGDAASVILFGLLTVLGVAGPKSLDAKRKRAMGEVVWTDTLARVRLVPLTQALSQIGIFRLLLGLALYGALLLAHEPVIGISPLPVF
ncbi:MAG: NnrU family protein [Rhodospirillaceae bacterium]|jgi:uncharacterized membrane protein|nr:NnrU family protein [Rhodospirillaceae bacterium]